MSKSIYCPKKCQYFEEGWLQKYCHKYDTKLELGPQLTLNGGRFARKCKECKEEALKDGNAD